MYNLFVYILRHNKRLTSNGNKDTTKMLTTTSNFRSKV